MFSPFLLVSVSSRLHTRSSQRSPSWRCGTDAGSERKTLRSSPVQSHTHVESRAAPLELLVPLWPPRAHEECTSALTRAHRGVGRFCRGPHLQSTLLHYLRCTTMCPRSAVNTSRCFTRLLFIFPRFVCKLKLWNIYQTLHFFLMVVLNKATKILKNILLILLNHIQS